MSEWFGFKERGKEGSRRHFGFRFHYQNIVNQLHHIFPGISGLVMVLAIIQSVPTVTITQSSETGVSLLLSNEYIENKKGEEKRDIV